MKKRGISLITLVITIIIVIILAGVVIVNITKSNPLDNATEAVFKENVSSYRDELEIYKGNQYINDVSFQPNKMNYPSKDIDKVIKSIKKKDKEKFVISKGQLCYNGDDEQEKEWARELGIEVTSSVILGLDTAVNKNSVTLSVSVREVEGNDYTYTYEIIDVEKIEDITEKTCIFNNLTLNKKYIAKVIVKYNGNEEELSKEFTTSQDFDLEITSENLEVNLFEDITTTFTATLHPNATYKWYYNEIEIAGETSNTYSISTSDMNANNYKGGKYKVEATLDGITQTAEAIQVVKPLEVSTANELKSLVARVNTQGITFKNETITQTQDIDLSTVCSESLGSWTPIGNVTYSYNGNYDGNNFSIDNLYINNPEEDSQALFYMVDGSIIKDIILSNAYVVGKTHVGTITAQSRCSTLKNISTEGGIVKGYIYAGGIAGSTYLCEFNSCKNNATISFSTCEIAAGSDAGGFGGIVGVSTGSVINKCVNYGEIGGFRYLGGIIGINWGEVSDCYNVGCINPTNLIEVGHVGGIVGTQAIDTPKIMLKNCYNVGKVNNYCNLSSYGAIIGTQTPDTTSNCYYLEGTYNCGISGADLLGAAEIRTESNMKTYDFVTLLGDDNFKIVKGKNSGYPILEWEDGQEDKTPNSSSNENFSLFYNKLAIVSDNSTETKLLDGGGAIIGYSDLQYGPYATLNAGTYRVRYVGENFNLQDKSNYYPCSVYDENSAGRFENVFEKIENNELIYTFTLDTTVTYVEIPCYNNIPTGENLTIRFIEITRVN